VGLYSLETVKSICEELSYVFMPVLHKIVSYI